MNLPRTPPPPPAISKRGALAKPTMRAVRHGTQVSLCPLCPLAYLSMFHFLVALRHAGVIDSTQPGPSGETLYKVTFLTFGNSESLLAEKLRPLQEPFDGSADPSKLKVRIEQIPYILILSKFVIKMTGLMLTCDLGEYRVISYRL